MFNNAENIEAKLCAYVEGDLDEAGRAEIEKHLESHPQHRALLDELKRTKSMMMSLPREQAPVDMAETLQGHLERSVLLDGVGAGDLDSTLKINRWPQLMSVAAVVLLALGLGVLVYVVLPEHSSTPVSFAVKTKDTLPTTQELSRAISEEDKAKADAVRDEKELGKLDSKPMGKVADDLAMVPADKMKDTDAATPAASAVVPAEALSLKKGGQGFVGKAELAMDRAGEGAAFGMGKFRSGRAEPKRVYVVVTTDNLETTNGQLATYLTMKNIAWQSGERGAMLASSQAGVDVAGLKSNGQAYQANGATTTNVSGANATGSANVFNNGTNSIGNSNVGANDYNAKNGYAQQLQKNYNGDNHGNQYTQSSNGGYVSKSAPQEMTQNAQGETRQVDEKQKLQQAEQTDQVAAPSFNLADAKNENVIIARGLTRQQAADLSDSLGKLYAGQTAVLVDQDEIMPGARRGGAEFGGGSGGGAGQQMTIAGTLVATPPTTNPAVTLAKTSEVLESQPGVVDGEQAKLPAAKPAEQPTATPPVATTDSPSKAMADQLNDSNERTRVAMNRKMKDSSGPPGPPGVPAAATELKHGESQGGDHAINARPTTAPATTGPSTPTTQPAAEVMLQQQDQSIVANDLTLAAQPTTRPADNEPVDVVIVIQPIAQANQAATTPAAPATQPADDAQSQPMAK